MRHLRFANVDWVALPGYLLFFLMMFVPTSYQIIKAPLLLLSVGAVAFAALRRGWLPLHMSIVRILLVNVAAGLFFIGIGLVNGAPGALAVSTVYCAWPVMMTILVAGITERRLASLSRVLVFAAIAVEYYIIAYVLTEAGHLPHWLFVSLDDNHGMSLEDGTIRVSFPSSASLVFLVPFAWAMLMTWPNRERLPVRRIYLWVALLLGVANTFLSGRRAILLTVALAPFIAAGFWFFLESGLRHRARRRIVQVTAGAILMGLALFGVLQLRFGLDPQAMYNSFASGFDFGANEDSAARKVQFIAMVHEWRESPIVGLGHGAAARESVRSFEFPWSYELSYVALLFHTGIAGVVVYSLSVLWIFVQGFRILRKGGQLALYMLPALTGLTCFLIANATNPYLEKYDFMWVIFFPVAIINLDLIGQSARPAPPLPPATVGALHP
jgi:hypothetical protein